MKKLLVGIGTDPAVVGAIRALVIYGLPIGVGLLVIYLNNLNRSTLGRFRGGVDSGVTGA